MYPIHVKANRPFRMPDRLAETKEHLPDVFLISGSMEILWNVQEFFGMCKRTSDSRWHLFLYILLVFYTFWASKYDAKYFSDPNKTWSSTIRSIRLMRVQSLHFDDGLCTICRELSNFSGETNGCTYRIGWWTGSGVITATGPLSANGEGHSQKARRVPHIK